jgi:hypothetical protein
MANRFWVGGTGTWNASNTANWAATTGGAGGQSVPGSADLVTIDSNSGSGTITINSTIDILSLTFNTANNIILDFSVNNNNVTIRSQFACTGTSVRTLKMGSGVWTFNYSSGNATLWNFVTNTNLTFDAGQSTIKFTYGGTGIHTFAGGGLTYYTFEIARGSSTAQTIITGSNTFANFIDNTSTAAHTISFTAATTTSFYNFNVRGNAGALVAINRSGATNPILAKVGRGIICYCDYITLGTITGSPSNTWYMGANSLIGSSTGFIATDAPSSRSLLGAGGVG